MLDLKIELDEFGNAVSYEKTITTLAMHTQGLYKGREINGGPFDITEVCCWMCEKPLANGMRLAHVPKSGKVSLIREPKEESDELDLSAREIEFPILKPWDEFMLLCGDCSADLINTSTDPIKEELIQKVETNYTVLDARNFIWPHRDLKLDENSELSDLEIKSSDCFIYTTKLAWIKHQKQEEGSDLETFDEEFVPYLFIEPNPRKPVKIQQMARNTIRLFRLNGSHYHYDDNTGYHEIRYNVSKSQTKYDDLRLEGRLKAEKRAKEALLQLRNLRTISAEEDILNIIISQQRILMELNGYRSIWAKVFNEGGDPGGFDDIVQVDSPTPITTPPKADLYLDESSPEKKDIAPYSSGEELQDICNAFVTEKSDGKLNVKGDKVFDDLYDKLDSSSTIAGSEFEEIQSRIADAIEYTEEDSDIDFDREIFSEAFLNHHEFIKKEDSDS